MLQLKLFAYSYKCRHNYTIRPVPLPYSSIPDMEHIHRLWDFRLLSIHSAQIRAASSTVLIQGRFL